MADNCALPKKSGRLNLQIIPGLCIHRDSFIIIIITIIIIIIIIIIKPR